MVSKQIAIVLALLMISGCSLLQQPPREVEIITKPIKIDIVQPVLPRSLNLKEPKWYVVSDTKIIENCLKTFKTKNTLEYHKQTAKFCLKKQGIINTTFKCNYCDKVLATQLRLTTHLNISCFKISFSSKFMVSELINE